MKADFSDGHKSKPLLPFGSCCLLVKAIWDVLKIFEIQSFMRTLPQILHLPAADNNVSCCRKYVKKYYAKIRKPQKKLEDLFLKSEKNWRTKKDKKFVLWQWLFDSKPFARKTNLSVILWFVFDSELLLMCRNMLGTQTLFILRRGNHFNSRHRHQGWRKSEQMSSGSGSRLCAISEKGYFDILVPTELYQAWIILSRPSVPWINLRQR